MALQDQVEQKLGQALFSAFYIYFLISSSQHPHFRDAEMGSREVQPLALSHTA